MNEVFTFDYCRKPVSLGVSNFAASRHFSEETGFTWTSMDQMELLEDISKNWNDRIPGTGDTTLDFKIQVPVLKISKVHSHFVQLQKEMQVQASVTQRQEGEDLFVQTFADANEGRPKVEIKFVKAILYSANALLENGGTRSTNADWELVCLVGSDIEEEPMEPLAMARNFLNKPGGTYTNYTAEQFAESIYFWSQRLKAINLQEK